jgi:hypothetical protein
MADFAELLRGVAALLWPVVALAAIFTFKEQIRSLIHRVKRAKVLGQEVELTESLDRLESTAEDLEEVVESAPQEGGHGGLQGQAGSGTDATQSAWDETEREILREASRSPKVAVILLAAEIESEARKLVAVFGLSPRIGRGPGRPNSSSLTRTSRILADRGSIGEATTSAIRQFQAVRNEVVHGVGTVSESEILRAVDSGLTILRALRSIPHERYTVELPNLPIYIDESLTQEFDGYCGAVIRVETPSGAEHTRIFPVRPGRYVAGQEVGWDWSFKKILPRAWYRDPETGEARTAWDESAEFAGTPLDAL